VVERRDPEVDALDRRVDAGRPSAGIDADRGVVAARSLVGSGSAQALADRVDELELARLARV
jgi:hypothetical protein